jgi:hypothetical protein
MQYAGAAGSAFLAPDAPFLKNTDKGRIESSVNGLFTIPFRYRLNTRAATKRENGIVSCNDFRGCLDKHIVTLTSMVSSSTWASGFDIRRKECRRNDAHFTFSPARQTVTQVPHPSTRILWPFMSTSSGMLFSLISWMDPTCDGLSAID